LIPSSTRLPIELDLQYLHHLDHIKLLIIISTQAHYYEYAAAIGIQTSSRVPPEEEYQIQWLINVLYCAFKNIFVAIGTGWHFVELNQF